jgi:hypothetical protein
VSAFLKKIESETELKYVSPDLLDFDPTNPRFGGLMDKRSQPEIQQELVKEPYYALELVDSLLKNGFIDYEPLVVKKNGERYIVVEGNRRLAAIREILAHQDRYEGRIEDLKEIPVLVFPEKPDEEQKNEMRIYLGVRHLLGFRDWPSLSKAQFLDRESKQGGLDKVLKELRLTKTQARRFLVPYRLLGHAEIAIPKGEAFFTLGEALSRTGIKNFIELEVDNNLKIESYSKKRLAMLLNYIYGPKKKTGERDGRARVISDTRDLSRLAKVLDSDKAASVLAAGKSIEEAEIHVDTREESLKRLAKLRKDLAVLVKKITAGSANPETARLVQTHKQFDSAAKDFISKEKP